MHRLGRCRMKMIETWERGLLSAPDSWLGLPVAALLRLGRVALFDDNESAFDLVRRALAGREDELLGDPVLRREWLSLARFALFESRDLPGRTVKARQ